MWQGYDIKKRLNKEESNVATDQVLYETKDLLHMIYERFTNWAKRLAHLEIVLENAYEKLDELQQKIEELEKSCVKKCGDEKKYE